MEECCFGNGTTGISYDCMALARQDPAKGTVPMSERVVSPLRYCASRGFLLMFVMWFSAEPCRCQLSGPPKCLAIVTFETLGGGKEAEWMGGGFAETLTTKLGALPGILVTERRQLEKVLTEIAGGMKGLLDPKTAQKVGKVLGAEYLVLGSVQLLGGLDAPDKAQLLANARVLRVDTAAILNTAQAQGTLAAVFQVEGQLAARLAEIITQKRLTDKEEEQLALRETEEVEAYRAYIQGVQFYQRFTPGANQEAISFFQQALQRDPKYASAHAALANAYAARYGLTGRKEEPLLDEAMKEARAALQINGQSAVAHKAMGMAYAFKGLMDDAVAAYKKAVELWPTYVEAYNELGLFLIQAGKPDRAVEFLTKASKLGTTFPWVHANLGDAYLTMGQLRSAEESYNRALKINPDLSQAHFGLGEVLAARKEVDQAKEEWKKAAQWDRSGEYARAAKRRLARMGYWLGRIAFNSRTDGKNFVEEGGEWSLSTVRPDGTELREIAKVEGECRPEWHPDGKRIFYLSGGRSGPHREVVMFDIETGQPRNVTSLSSYLCSISCAPDGKSALVDRQGTAALLTLTKDLTTPLTEARELLKGKFPRFSPDGGWLAFFAPASRDEAQSSIWVTDVAGKEKTELGGNPDNTGTLSISPDGSLIAFCSTKRPYLFTMDVRTREVRPVAGPGECKIAPCFSPDGEWIAYGGGANFGTLDNEIYVVRLDGSGGRRLTKNDYWDGWPAWSTD